MAKSQLKRPDVPYDAVRQEADCKNMVDVAVETFGELHVAFNNHGVSTASLFADVAEEEISRIFDTNLKSLVFCFKYQVQYQGRRWSHGMHRVALDSDCACSEGRGGVRGAGSGGHTPSEGFRRSISISEGFPFTLLSFSSIRS